ncbi:MAG TPA: ELM1/GtrOC1 family putative glycosyltransferase, partial [Dokdonella sp.]
RAQRLDAAWFDALLERLFAHQGPGSFLVSVSRRTPGPIAERLRQAFARHPGVFWAGPQDGPNPYAGLLAWADRLVVTPDSVNMLSEACATGRPVYTFTPRPVRGKLAAFHAELAASGHLRQLGEATARPQPPPLAETAAIAELVRGRWDAAREGRTQVWPRRGSS